MKSPVNTSINQKNHRFISNVIYVKLFMFFILIFTSLCFSFSKCYGQNDLNAMKGTINILNSPQRGTEPQPNPLDHRQYEVEIFKIIFDEPFMGKGKQVYSIRYYMKNRDNSIKYQKAWFGTDDEFDKATYQWANDTAVAVIMTNSLTEIADTLELFSDNGGSGIKTKD